MHILKMMYIVEESVLKRVQCETSGNFLHPRYICFGKSGSLEGLGLLLEGYVEEDAKEVGSGNGIF